MKKENRKQIGNYGEKLALEAYQEAGYKLVAQQYRCPNGEIDLILQKDNIIIFVEVRTKTSNRYGTAEESITEKKKQTIRKVSQYFLNDAQYKGGDSKYILQYDVISIYIDKQKKKAWLTRYEQAF
jgi:putative endonuclease